MFSLANCINIYNYIIYISRNEHKKRRTIGKNKNNR